MRNFNKMNDIKLIVSDIDGTLVGDGQGYGALDYEYYEVIHELVGRGIRFMACSGRQRQSITKLFQPIISDIYMACDGGSNIFRGGNLLFSKTLPREIANAVICDARKVDLCDVLVCTAKRAYCEHDGSEMYHWMVDSYGFDMEVVKDMTCDIKEEIVKVSVYHKDRAEELTNPWFRPKWEKENVKLSLAGIQWLDCVPKDAGKGTALRFMQEHFHVTPEQTLVFGDDQNDMEMFEQAGVSYAVAGARDEVKQAAMYECDSYENNGVLKILKKLF